MGTEVLLAHGWIGDESVAVNPEAVKFRHPNRGTCVPECPWFGVCHDFCGRPTGTARDKDRFKADTVPGRPFAYLRGHHLANLHSAGPGFHSGAVPMEKVRPLVDWLERRYGTQAEVARLLEMSPQNYSKWRRGTWPTTDAKTWRRVQALVLAHRTPQDPFATFEPRRVLPREEQRQLDRDADSRRRRAHRYERLGIPDPREGEAW